MDRAADYGSAGWGFKSLRARQIGRYIQFPLSGVSSRVAGASDPRDTGRIDPPFAHGVRAGVGTVSREGAGRDAFGSRSASGRYQIVRRQDTFGAVRSAPVAVGGLERAGGPYSADESRRLISYVSVCSPAKTYGLWPVQDG